jgi:hypothetical protein
MHCGGKKACPMERVLSSRTFRSGRVAKMAYSETDEPDATHQTYIYIVVSAFRFVFVCFDIVLIFI